MEEKWKNNPERFKDKNRLTIKAGDIIFNEFDEDKYHKIILHKGELCFEKDREPLSVKHQLNLYWEVKDVMKCDLCGQYFEKGDLGAVFYHEHKDLPEPESSGSKKLR